MHTRQWLSVSAVAIALILPLRASAPVSKHSVEPLPPLSYVCPMPADAAVIEDQPGKCPKCGMTLVPVRLDSKWWCPIHQLVEVHDSPGKCRRDGRDLVQVTLSEFWRCSGEPDERLTEPGTCSDGQPRQVAYELRAHGDHNPRHGGQFFMAEDQWHHLEGAYPRSGVFRAYFYDNFTKPMAVKEISGTLLILDGTGRELGSYALKPGRISNTLEAHFPPSALPVKAAAKVRFTPGSREQRFDFSFADYSKDSVPATVTRAVPTTNTPATKGVSAAEVVKVPSPTQDSTRPSAAAASNFVDLSQTPPALAAALDESTLPTSISGLLIELGKRSKEIEQLVHDGNLGQIWLPAMGTKTVALAIATRSRSLPPAQHAAVLSAIKRIVTGAWQLDAYGDLGNRAKIDDAYAQVSSAVADLNASYQAAQ
jgi:hypothetical protein